MVVEPMAVATHCQARSRTMANHIAGGGAREIRTHKHGFTERVGALFSAPESVACFRKIAT